MLVKRIWKKNNISTSFNNVIDIWDSGTHIYERWPSGDMYWKIVSREITEDGFSEILKRMPEWDSPGPVLHLQQIPILVQGPLQAQGPLQPQGPRQPQGPLQAQGPQQPQGPLQPQGPQQPQGPGQTQIQIGEWNVTSFPFRQFHPKLHQEHLPKEKRLKCLLDSDSDPDPDSDPHRKQ